MTGEQLRAARALLKIGTRELAALAGVDKMSIVGCERGRRTQAATVAKIGKALETAGIVFLDGRDGEYQPTAALRWGAKPFTADDQADDTATGKRGEGLDSRAWDDDFEHASQDGEHVAANVTDEMRAEMREYLATAKMSPRGKAVVARAMRL